MNGWWIGNRREISICTDTITKHKKENILFFQKKFKKNANADSNDDVDAEMPMLRYPSDVDKNTFWWLLPDIELNEYFFTQRC